MHGQVRQSRVAQLGVKPMICRSNLGNSKLASLLASRKLLQDKLFKQLPLFALFKSDRESKDNDPQAEIPFKKP